MNVFLLILIFAFFITSPVFAKEINCDNRFATLVNPVRGRDLWVDKSLEPLKNQYNAVKQNNFAATWLLQYEVLVDSDLLDEIEKFDDSQEVGVFLEVSERLAEKSRVIYPHATAWFSPKAVFLSAYTQSERRKLIDKLFKDFKGKFGFYPKSVGAWWIDSYSLNYMKERYGIRSAMIVADQKTTDNYGVWGQWWGVPYYPSIANILTPASDLENKQDVVIIQWAQRDPEYAFGEGPVYSNYSLQANDYIRQGKDTDYFKGLVNLYLDCRNSLGQITVGLETGMESVAFISEYENQLKSLSTIPDLKLVTMSQFADSFSLVFPQIPQRFLIGAGWILKTISRSNDELKDYIEYHQDIAFKDYFVADRENFLDRNLQRLKKSSLIFFPWFLILISATGIFFLYKRSFHLWIIGTFFALTSFGLILRSHYLFGWQIFYGPKIPILIMSQIIVVLISYLIIWLLSRARFIKNIYFTLWFIPLSFGLDFLVKALRFSYFDQRYYVGIALDNLRFVGFSFSSFFDLKLLNLDFPAIVASSLLRFNYEKIWDQLYIALLIYPLFHILLGFVLAQFVAKFPDKFKRFVIIILVILTYFYLRDIFQADPRLVQ